MKQTKNFMSHGYTLIFIAGFLWGCIGLFVKELENAGSTPELTAFLRVFFAFIIMLIASCIKGGWRSLIVDGKTLLSCALLGLICHGIYNIFYSLAVTMAGVSVSAVLLNIAPVFTLFFSAMLFREKITAIKLAAIVINIFGCVLTVTNGVFDIQTLSIIGLLCGVGAGICYALTSVIGKLAADKTDPFVMSMYSYLFAAMFLALWMKPWQQEIHCDVTILVWGALYALIPTAIAYVIYYRGLQSLTENSKAPVIASVETVVAAVIGVTIYREQIGGFSIIGIVLVLISIVIMNMRLQHKNNSKIYVRGDGNGY